MILMNNKQKLEQLNWLKSLPVVIDLDENGEPTDLSQLNELFERIDQEIQEIKEDERQQ